MAKSVLFLCTGNYYRSRFAAALFDHLARRVGIDWRATSRGLKIGWPGNVGAVSAHTRARLAELEIPIGGHGHMPLQCAACDLSAADLVVALKEAEHRAMIAREFAGWEGRVTYWHVHDLDQATPPEALREIEHLVRNLVNQLQLGGGRSGEERSALGDQPLPGQG